MIMADKNGLLETAKGGIFFRKKKTRIIVNRNFSKWAELWQSRDTKPKNQEVLCVQYPSLSPLFAVLPPLPFCLFPWRAAG